MLLITVKHILDPELTGWVLQHLTYHISKVPGSIFYVTAIVTIGACLRSSATWSVQMKMTGQWFHNILSITWHRDQNVPQVNEWVTPFERCVGTWSCYAKSILLLHSVYMNDRARTKTTVELWDIGFHCFEVGCEALHFKIGTGSWKWNLCANIRYICTGQQRDCMVQYCIHNFSGFFREGC